MDERRLPPTLGADGEPERPSAARMYDALLGGFQHAAVDREAVRRAQAIYPDIALAARANRAFLRRAVTFLADRGVDRFLDLGSGIPTAGNTHDVAQRRDPAARVLYVDVDPLAVAHSAALLADNPQAAALRADARDIAAILAHPATRRLLDRDRPVGALLLTLLHFIPDDDEAYALVRALRDALPPGSYLVISHFTHEGAPLDVIAQVERLYGGTATPVRARTAAAIARFFDGWTLVAPGLVPLPLWHQDDPDAPFLDDPARSLGLVGVARTP